MHPHGMKLLNLMFEKEDKVCVSHNKYGYRSVPLHRVLSKEVVLSPNDVEKRPERVGTDNLIFAALNPIEGIRNDENCVRYRNFLVEMDDRPLAQQLKYVEDMGMPFSAAVFSGGKSIHFLISLDKDLPNEETYRIIAEWILNIMTAADQQTKNPSRMIRIPGAMRDNGKQQRLVRFNGTVKLDDLKKWLSRREDLMPKPEKKNVPTGDVPSPEKLKKWVMRALKNGIDESKGRNKQWFTIACEFALAGYSVEDATDIMYEYFTPQRDFKHKEWKASIASGYKHIYSRKR